MSPPQEILRAAGLGLGAAFLVGGLYACFLGVQSAASPVRCTELQLSESECALASDLRRDEIRLFLPEGAALVMLSTAIFLGLRKLQQQGIPK